jgi:O-antigen biosynthesis protein WbqP
MQESGYRIIKRSLDVLFSVLLLLFLAFPMAVIWAAVRIDSRGGGIFRQVRIGRGGIPFVCYKFRTMYLSAPDCCPSAKLCNAERYITPVGRFLRRTSLDELPQLFNVLKGDMSLVGPRPLIAQETEVHRRRMERGVYDLRPGITGLSQVMGRDRLTDDIKAELDARYLEEFGFIQDVRIIGRTVGKVITGEGIAKNK